ncbi:MAG: saccharopine dehydrogenase NADP-binding domain-containing protein, partial [Woeseiaceae bacterium]|nr:saccharopine dehydrogenase NADP-binding domain-containing protein [Woeseiaceae bacterium]
MTTDTREFDVVVWGATGFTGSLVAEYLLDAYGANGSVRWALAARDESKLAALRESLGGGAASLPTILADSNDESSLDALTRRTRVVLTTVGPYAKYGSKLVAACVQNGTHYCDLAGEAQWIQKMIDEHHDRAAASGARIVHCCGFDSVPSDMSVWFLQQQAQARHGDYCHSITMLVKAMKGGASGGTFASMMNIIRESRADRSIARALANPYTLNPPGEREGPERRDQKSAELHEASGLWTAPFVMAGINTRVVRRSHALQGYPYGRDFRYHEAVVAGQGAAGRVKANMLTAGIGAFVTAAAFDLSRSALERFVLPAPGEGPDEEARENGFFDLRTWGELADGTVIRGKTTG